MPYTENKEISGLTEQEMVPIILALATYVEHGQAGDDGYTEDDLAPLRAKLKRECNRQFNTNWAIIE